MEGVCVYRYRMLILGIVPSLKYGRSSVLLESGLGAVTHSQMSGSLTDSVSGALFSCPGFDGLGAIRKVIVQARASFATGGGLSWKAQLGVKTERFC